MAQDIAWHATAEMKPSRAAEGAAKPGGGQAKNRDEEICNTRVTSQCPARPLVRCPHRHRMPRTLPVSKRRRQMGHAGEKARERGGCLSDQGDPVGGTAKDDLALSVQMSCIGWEEQHIGGGEYTRACARSEDGWRKEEKKGGRGGGADAFLACIRLSEIRGPRGKLEMIGKKPCATDIW